jgi:hypothetical protein
MSTSEKKHQTKKFMIMTILVIATSSFLLTSAVVTTSSLFANAIIQNQNMMGGMGKPMMNNGFSMKGMINNNFPQINGTINLKNNTNNISIKNISVPFLTAAQSAQSAISNGTIIGGNIGITQGFLTYNFAISNPTNNTLSKVIVDAGNGKVLYTSPGLSLNSTQFAMKGMNSMNDGFGGHGMNDGFGGHGMNDGFGGHGMNDGFGGHWGANHNQRW